MHTCLFSSFSLPSGRLDVKAFARHIGIGLLACILGCGITLAQGWQHLGKVQRVEKFEDGIELTAGAGKVRITQVYDGVLRVRVAPDGHFPKDISWALVETHMNYRKIPVQLRDEKNEVK